MVMIVTVGMKMVRIMMKVMMMTVTVVRQWY